MNKKKKLNYYGMTSVEMLVSFVIVVAIVVGMFDVVMNYKNKQQIESINNSVISYSNSLQKTIQDDLIKRKPVDVQLTNTTSSVSKEGAQILFDDSSIGVFSIDTTNNVISYGLQGNVINYPLPEIADLTLSADTEVEFIKANVSFIKITVVLLHPNFENERYTFHIISPVTS